MLENKITPSALTGASASVFETNWVRETGRGIAYDTYLYTNNTGRMLMWSFEMVSTYSTVTDSYFYPRMKSHKGAIIPMETDYRWNTSSTSGWSMHTASTTAVGHYRFAGNSSAPSRWIMLPAGFIIFKYGLAAFSSSYEIDYKLTVVEEDTSLLVNRN